MSNPASPANSDSSCGGDASPMKNKAWPPRDGDTKPFLVSDFDVPIDVDLTRVEFLSVDDLAFFCVYSSNAEIHAALAIPGAPVAQGATPALSAAAFKAFVVAEFGAVCNMGICGVARSPPALGTSDAAFQRLSNAEATALTNRQAAHFMWGGAVAATVGASTGLLYEMTPKSRRRCWGWSEPASTTDPSTRILRSPIRQFKNQKRHRGSVPSTKHFRPVIGRGQ